MKLHFLAWFFLCLGSLNVLAHDPNGDLTGQVLDHNGVSLNTVEVLAVDSDGRDLAQAFTNEEGLFQLSHLPKTFDLVVTHSGFRVHRQEILMPVKQQPLKVYLVQDEGMQGLVESFKVYAATPRTAASSSTFRQEALNITPVETPGDLLRIIPGMVIAQHGGGGKSDQYLIRGFDADHGTDFALFFEGIPVNMVSHGHGQGYADLSFLIPETLEAVDVYKGNYFTEYGNLGTAGTAQLRLRESFEESFLHLQSGNHNTQRVLAVHSPKQTRAKGFVAVDGFFSDGPFIHPQEMKRYNFATRWSLPMGDDQKLSMFLTGYDGEWNASGQVPLRAVEAGMDRFDSHDPTEGGTSSRYNLSMSYVKRWGTQSFKSQVYAASYDLDLFSNFTIALNDPVNGDGIEQVDDRNLYGGHLQYFNVHEGFGKLMTLTAGLDYRADDIKVGLYTQRERQRLETTVDSRVNERNLALYVQEELAFNHHLKVIAGIRYDQFDFAVDDIGGLGPAGKQTRDIFQPKLSLVVTADDEHTLQFFFNYGRGFHSNDSRSVVADPEGVALAPSDGYEFGFNKTFGKKLEINFAYWLLDLDSEVIWVGDEGTTEFGDATRRHGPDFEVRWNISDNWHWSLDYTDVKAFFTANRDYIPRAPRASLATELTYRGESLNGTLKLRGIEDFPLKEDNSVQGDGFEIVDLFLRKSLGKVGLTLTVENLLDSEVKEAQTLFESRYPYEANPIEDNHFTPGNPITYRLGIELKP